MKIKNIIAIMFIIRLEKYNWALSQKRLHLLFCIKSTCLIQERIIWRSTLDASDLREYCMSLWIAHTLDMTRKGQYWVRGLVYENLIWQLDPVYEFKILCLFSEPSHETLTVSPSCLLKYSLWAVVKWIKGKK